MVARQNYLISKLQKLQKKSKKFKRNPRTVKKAFFLLQKAGFLAFPKVS